MKEIPIIPGRGLNIPSAIEARQKYIESNGLNINKISEFHIDTSEIQKNIENFIGSVEIPVGIIGPLLFKSRKGFELTYTLAGTLEGAMVASMNRGARAVSLSNGFKAKILRQKMVRAPLFILQSKSDCEKFKEWIFLHFKQITDVALNHSNHAKLLSVDPFIIRNAVHLKFVYSTGDASGQNMTTTCTWHAIQWIVDNFQKETGIIIDRYIIEGNGSCDKKVSTYNINSGRGISVMVECHLKEDVINKILRTSSVDMLAFFGISKEMAKIDGMPGYNINVANAIAAIFVATGQDLASIHESSVGILNLKKLKDGLLVSLHLPTLVIGTVGGGTHLTRQKQALELMGCYGTGKIERFASLIAGFAMSLDISTYAAIVSGAFAKAHEKLGRNKPIDWLLKSEITADFIRKCLVPELKASDLKSIEVGHQDNNVENGIITEITGKTSNKLIGFIPITIRFERNGTTSYEQILIKSKALDIDVIKGLHTMAAAIDTQLSDLLSKHKEKLEYWNCHIKELSIFEQLHQSGFDYFPAFKGKCINREREIYLLFLEFINPENTIHINTQKTPEVWTKEQIFATIKAITDIHLFFKNQNVQEKVPEIVEFKPWKSKELYQKFISLMVKESDSPSRRKKLSMLYEFLEALEDEHNHLNLPKTIIHNDFNSRNIAICRKDSRNFSPCIYDWELAVINFPHRDIVEFLSFVLVSNFKKEDLVGYLTFHFECSDKKHAYSFSQWKQGYIYALKEYLVTRISYYEVAGILAKYAFSERVMNNCFRMLEILGKDSN